MFEVLPNSPQNNSAAKHLLENSRMFFKQIRWTQLLFEVSIIILKKIGWMSSECPPKQFARHTICWNLQDAPQANTVTTPFLECLTPFVGCLHNAPQTNSVDSTFVWSLQNAPLTNLEATPFVWCPPNSLKAKPLVSRAPFWYFNPSLLGFTESIMNLSEYETKGHKALDHSSDPSVMYLSESSDPAHSYGPMLSESVSFIL